MNTTAVAPEVSHPARPQIVASLKDSAKPEAAEPRKQAFEKVLDRAQRQGRVSPKGHSERTARKSGQEKAESTEEPQGPKEEAARAEGSASEDTAEAKPVDGQTQEGEEEDDSEVDLDSGASVAAVASTCEKISAMAASGSAEKAAEGGDTAPAMGLVAPAEQGEAPELLGAGNEVTDVKKAAEFGETLQAGEEGAEGTEEPLKAGVGQAKHAEAAGKVVEVKAEAASGQVTAEGGGAATIARQAAEVIGAEKVIGPPPPPPEANSESANASVRQANVARVAKGLYAAASAGGGAVTLRLSPPEMGIVRVEMQLQHGVVRAKLLAEQDSARDLLGQRVGELRMALERQGLVVERLQVEALPNHTPTAEAPRGEQGREGQQGGQSPEGERRRGREEQGKRSFEAELLNMVA